MEFDLKARLKFSDNLPQEADFELQKAIEAANNVLFIKGVPSNSVNEAGRIIEWHTNANELYIRIVSGRYTRSHEALLRFRKALGTIIGPKYRIGIRGYEIEEFTILIEAETPVHLKLPFVQEVSFENKVLKLKLLVSEQDVENKIPDRIVSLVEEKIKQEQHGTKLENWELIWKSPEKTVFFQLDPTEVLQKRQWIKHGMSRGQWIFGPQITKVFSTFQRVIEKEIIKQLGYSEMIFPKMVPWEVWKRSGHARGIYPEIYYISSPKTRDPDYWEEVTDYYKVTNEIPLTLIREKIDDPI
ncbi:MAG TPA: hypothetical protein VIH90_02900, partial [Candidatus Saccharimonadales bacterium]